MKLLRIAMMAVALMGAAFGGPKPWGEEEARMWIRPEDEAHQKTVEQLMEAIRAKLPPIWTVSYDKKLAWLEVSLNKEVLLNDSRFINGPMSERKLMGQFVFGFRVLSFVAVPEHRRLSLENEKIADQAKVIYDELEKRNVNHRWDEFYPKTDEDRELVAKFEAIERSEHHLPPYYFQDICLGWVTHPPDGYNELVPDDPKVKAECHRIEVKLLKILEAY